MTKEYLKRIWLANAPADKWSSGPSVIYNFHDAQETIDKYRDMGYYIYGPYDLSDTDGRLDDLK